MNSKPVAAAWAACWVIAGAALLAWGQAPAALPERYAEVVLSVDGMV